MNHSINTIRFLGLDAINKANSGHPGIVLGAAPMIYTLYAKIMRVTPNDSNWFNRDRFILAAGHGSAMLYATLHLAGYDISIEDLKQFRQIGSKTPGHPEYGHTDGVDATSGPLGQGIAMATGMAIAERYLSATFNKEDLNVVDHYTYVLCGDGDLQEGVTQEAMSLAGNLGLGKLIVLYDSNDIQLDGPVKWVNTENVKEKYTAMNWHYLKVRDANNLTELEEAIRIAQGVTNRPSIIEVKSIIGYGSKLAGDSATHGSPLGVEETNRMRKELNYPAGEFEVLPEVYEDFKENVIKRGDKAKDNWLTQIKKYQEAYPEAYNELKQIITGKLDVNWSEVLPKVKQGQTEASRVSGGKVLNALSEAIPSLIGGSADLTKSTKAKGINGDFSQDNPRGRNINYGVREHAMAAIVNGLTLHGLRGFGGGFFVFSDYMKPAIRMAALMKIPSLFIFTHDSVAVGEDGPTHEPIEQLSMLRTTPNLMVFRPANASETNHVFRLALERTDGPSVIVLSRQNLTVDKVAKWSEVKRGAYVLKDVTNAEGILIATGSEVELALKAQEQLQKKGVYTKVVSMPSIELFLKQNKKYQESVLPQNIQKRLAIEMGSSSLWYRFSNNVMGIDTFGESGPGSEVIEHFGFNVENVVKQFRKI
jgi:transketolase